MKVWALLLISSQTFCVLRNTSHILTDRACSFILAATMRTQSSVSAQGIILWATSPHFPKDKIYVHFPQGFPVVLHFFFFLLLDCTAPLLPDPLFGLKFTVSFFSFSLLRTNSWPMLLAVLRGLYYAGN